MKYILVYPDTHEAMGLFDDLKKNVNVQMIVGKRKKINSKLLSIISRLHLSWSINKYVKLPFRRVWYKGVIFNIDDTQQYTIIIVDAAIKTIDINYLRKTSEKINVKMVLVLLNAMGSQSVAIMETKAVMDKIAWDKILTFDPEDSRKYGYDYLGCCYYSKKEIKSIEKPENDVYFVGGLKGGREEIIIKTFELLNEYGIRLDFNLMLTGKRKYQDKPYFEKIHYRMNQWVPYSAVITGINNSNVILEVIQNEQSGPTVRYYEAVCYNKKLLTNNSNIVSFPFYNSKYMKIYSRVEDIDLSWVVSVESVDYGYDGSFSPIHLLEKV